MTRREEARAAAFAAALGLTPHQAAVLVAELHDALVPVVVHRDCPPRVARCLDRVLADLHAVVEHTRRGRKHA